MGWSPGGRSAGFMVVVVATSSVVALTTIILWKLNGSNSYVSKNCCSKQAMKQKRRYAGAAGDAGDAGHAGDAGAGADADRSLVGPSGPWDLVLVGWLGPSLQNLLLT